MKAIVLGASGLTGNELLQQLLQDDFFTEIKLFLRKSIPLNHPKLIQHEIDFNHLENCTHLIEADIVFCCLGTTIKTAGSQEAFKKVDYTYPLEFAKIAKQKGVPSFHLQSSLGSGITSKNFYLKTKAEIELAIQHLQFQSFVIFKPSVLLGNRKEFRLAESISKKVMQLFSFLFIGKLKRYKAINVTKVAQAMIKEAKLNKKGVHCVENEDMV